MTKTSAQAKIGKDSPDRRSQKNPKVRIQVMSPVWPEYFQGRWENVSEDCIRLTMPSPVAPGSVISVRTRSLLIRGRVQSCQNLNQLYLADAAVDQVSLLGHAEPVSQHTAGLVRLLLALESLDKQPSAA
jgi:hypothetical protein